MNDEIKIYKKGWGYEKWITNSEKYCCKILHFEQGKQCSWHYHLIKDETFYLLNGEMLIFYSTDDSLETSNVITLHADEKFYIPVGLRHRMYAVSESDLLEVSTQHFEEDSIRIIKGD